MTRRFTAFLCGLLAITLNLYPACGQLVFKTALQKKYDFKTVSCLTCHAKGKDAKGKPLGKEHRNLFGKQFEKLLKSKQVTKRLNDAKALKDAKAKQKVTDAVTAEFLEALKKVEQLKSPTGPAWGELLREAKIEGVKKKPAK
jgi:hypothetical protein